MSAGLAEFEQVYRLMQALTAVAMIVVGLEWQALQAGGLVRDVWRNATLRRWWGWRRQLMTDAITRTVPIVQVTCATLLLLAAMLDDRRDPMGSLAAAALACTVWHTAVRVRGTMNGGSDGMLFTVLLSLAVATAPVPPIVQQGALLYVAAQVLLSYLRAGWVKVRERDWWTGDALAAFLAVPAYAAPHWMPRRRSLLQPLSLAVMCFELSAPAALLSVRAAYAYTAAALAFHVATAVLFGLNRFVLAWSAALPAVWFAAHRVHAAN